MKDCDEILPLLSVYFDGECTPKESACVRRHLKTCAACRARLQEYTLMRKSFPDDFGARVPADFTDNVMSVIRSGSAPQEKRRCAAFKKILLPLAACLVIALTLSGLSGHTLQLPKNTAAQSFEKTSAPAKSTAKKTTTVMKRKTTAVKHNKTFSSQKASVSESAAPDTGAESSASSDKENSGSAEHSSGTAACTATGSVASAPYHKWVSVTGDAAGSLLDNFDGVSDTDPASGESAMRYEMTAEKFDAIAAQLDGASIHVNSDAGLSLCCVYVLSGN